MAEGEPLIRWDWLARNAARIWALLAEHVELALVPVLLGLVVAVPLGVACTRWRWLYPPALTATTVAYALPAIALFGLFLGVFGLAKPTVVVPLTLYSLSVLLPAVVDGMRSVPDPVRQAATAMGYGASRRLVQVELPIAAPVVVAGLRVATVSNISLVSVGALIGIGGLGELFTDGFQRAFPTPIVVGIAAILLLAFAADLLLVVAGRVLTPWSRGRSSR